MSQPGVVFPRTGPGIMSDDGDALTFCSTCAFSQACLSEGMDKSALMDLHVLVEHVGPLHPGEHVFREGDPFTAIAAVRAGTVKTYQIDRNGHEQVLGFWPWPCCASSPATGPCPEADHSRVHPAVAGGTAGTMNPHCNAARAPGPATGRAGCVMPHKRARAHAASAHSSRA